MKRTSTLSLLVLFLCTSVSLSAQDALQTVLNHLAEQSELNESDIANPIVTDQYTTQHLGVTHVYLRQQHEGIPVYNANMNFNVYQKSGKLISSGGHFVPNLTSVINTTTPAFKPSTAIQKAAELLHVHIGEIRQIEGNNSTQEYLYDKADWALEDVPVRLVYHAVSDEEVRLCWYIKIYEKSAQHAWSIRLDAVTGEILNQIDQVLHCEFGHPDPCKIEAFQNSHNQLLLAASAIPLPAANEYHVFEMPVESPNHGPRTYANSPWAAAPNASPFGWHDWNGSPGPEATITRGNNVHAYEDQNATNGSSNNEPNGGTNLDFDFPLNLTATPSSYEDAAVVNLFYWNNLMHDVWYQYGFDEVSGNFQRNNYSKGGAANDWVKAEAQDGSGTNNANFYPPADGQTPRMQMFIWNGSPNTNIVTVNSPTGISGSYFATQSTFAPGVDGTPLTGNVVEAFSSGAVPSEACNAITNASAVSGNIGMIDRGDCTFVTKAQNVQNAGAIACIVCNNVAGAPITMGGQSNNINIPMVMMSQTDCNLIKNQLPGVSVTLVNNGGATTFDSDFDNGVIAHEYGHGISTRLTGGPANSDCLSGDEQMGEGWSDWMALMMTMQPGDQATDIKGIGTFVASQPTVGDGIRPEPYTTNTSINGYTYANLCSGQVSVPHGVGFVWATMLWDLTWALIDEYGYDDDKYNGIGGNNIAMQIIMDGMKLQACAPGFVNGRDAILLADELNYGGENQCLIWEAFANRGLGFSAQQGSSADRCDGTAAFDLPEECSSLTVTKTAVSSVQAGDIITYTLEVENRKSSTVTNVTVTDNLPSGATYVPNSATCGGTESAGTLTFNLGTMASGDSNTCSFEMQLDASPFSTIYLEDDAESGITNWQTTETVGSGWNPSTNQAKSGSTSFYAVDEASSGSQYLRTANSVVLGANAQLRFWHFYDTETDWDGGVVEISLNNGGSWIDLGPNIIKNGYNGTIEVNPASPISGQEAFTGSSLGFRHTIIDLSSYSGSNALIRFHMATDGYVGSTGWFVDDIQLLDAIDITNEACVSSNQGDIDCDDVNTLVLEGTSIRVYAKAFLQGAYDTGSGEMTTDLNTFGLLPFNQPFSTIAAWNYTGAESVTSFDPDVVDWVLVELRNKNNPSIIEGTAAGFLLKDGSLQDVDGNPGVRINTPGISPDDYYLVIRQKSHLAVMSSGTISYPTSNVYDFSTAASQASGSAQLVDVGGGVHAMHAGEFTNDGVFSLFDFNNYIGNSSGILQYTNTDTNLDGFVTVADYNWYRMNSSIIGISEVQ